MFYLGNNKCFPKFAMKDFYVKTKVYKICY